MDPAFPRITMELSEHEIKEYFTPRDLAIGTWRVQWGSARGGRSRGELETGWAKSISGVEVLQPAWSRCAVG